MCAIRLVRWLTVALMIHSNVQSFPLQDVCASVTAKPALSFSATMCALSPKIDIDGGDRAWEVKLTTGKGRGMFALRDITKGSHILVEKPLFSVKLPEFVPGKGYNMAVMVEDVARQYSLLEPQDREEFDSCHAHRLEGDGQDDSSRLMSILRSNGYTTQDPDGRMRVGMYPQAALINHSCEPNVLNPDSEIRSIIAIRDIRAGEEILTTYIPLLTDTASRQARLHQYGFECDCRACRSRDTDAERTSRGNDFQELEQAVASPMSKTAEAILYGKAEALAQYVEDQGFVDYSVKTIRFAYEFAMRVGDETKARLWAKKHLEILQLIDPDSVETQRARQRLERI